MNTDELIQAHRNKFLIKLSSLRNISHLFDFTIFVADKKIQAHRLVLAACSDYFTGMFAHKCRELEEGAVVLQDVDANAVELIVDFCYTSRLDLNNENIQYILEAASRLQVQAVLDLCIRFIEDRIDASNCLGVLQLSERCNLIELEMKARNFSLRNFKYVIKEQEFLRIDEYTLARLISDDKLIVDDETIVLQAVIRWYQEDTEGRKANLYKLLKEVRYVFMDPATLVGLSDEHLIQSSPECRNLIDSAKNYLLLKSNPAGMKRDSELITRPRHQMQQWLYVVGGWHEETKAMSSAEMYDPNADVWRMILPMSEQRCGAGLTTLNDSIYALGGHNGSSHQKTVERYDIDKEQWYKDVQDMQYARTSLAVVSLKDKIFAIGGQNGDGAYDSVEMYDPVSNTWTDRRPMNQRRFGAGVVVHRGLIYVMGGARCRSKDGCEQELIYDSMERYDPDKDTWADMAPMRMARKHLGSCTFNGMIYAIGGRNENGELDSAEVYDPDEDTWRDVSPMPTKRSGIGLVEMSGHIYAIGGQGIERLQLNKVEVYDPETDTWTQRRPMMQRRVGGGVAVHPMRKF